MPHFQRNFNVSLSVRWEFWMSGSRDVKRVQSCIPERREPLLIDILCQSKVLTLSVSTLHQLTRRYATEPISVIKGCYTRDCCYKTRDDAVKYLGQVVCQCYRSDVSGSCCTSALSGWEVISSATFCETGTWKKYRVFLILSWPLSLMYVACDMIYQNLGQTMHELE